MSDKTIEEHPYFKAYGWTIEQIEEWLEFCETLESDEND